MLHAATGGRVAPGGGYFLLKRFKGKTKCCGFPDVIWVCSRNTGASCTTIALRLEGYMCVCGREECLIIYVFKM